MERYTTTRSRRTPRRGGLTARCCRASTRSATRTSARGRLDAPDFAAACIDGGATLLQLRAKHVVVAHTAGRCRRDRRRQSRPAGTPSSSTIARTSPGCPAPPACMSGRTICLRPPSAESSGPTAIVGLSTHTVAQLAAAVAEPVDYVAIGPVFGTATKDTGYTPSGSTSSGGGRRLAGSRQLPLVAIGGITLERATSVIAAGRRVGRGDYRSSGDQRPRRARARVSRPTLARIIADIPSTSTEEEHEWLVHCSGQSRSTA